MTYLKCEKCSAVLEGKQIRKAVWLSGYKAVTCSSCKTTYIPSRITRLLIGILMAFPILMGSNIHQYIGSYIIIAYALWLILLVLITPYVAFLDEKRVDEKMHEVGKNE